MGTLIGRSKEARKVNSIFGEGVNPLYAEDPRRVWNCSAYHPTC